MKGTYTLLLVCRNSFRRRIPRLGFVEVRRGCYVYTGSALGHGAVSLEGRVRRHRRASKKISWHVDYLTSRGKCKVNAAICLKSRKRLECSIARAITSELNVTPVFSHAGSSDCGCQAHLVKVEQLMSETALRGALMRIYSEFGRPVIL